MTKRQQKQLLRMFCNQIRDALLARADKWPDEWDGHDLRELAAYAFDYERTRLMREDKKRAAAVRNAIAVDNLY